jgi:hypothetical protein
MCAVALNVSEARARAGSRPGVMAKHLPATAKRNSSPGGMCDRRLGQGSPFLVLFWRDKKEQRASGPPPYPLKKHFSIFTIIMKKEIKSFNSKLPKTEKEICNTLAEFIDENLKDAENKIWHAHPVWFLDGNPIVGYSKLKDCIRLLFWSGQSFEEEGLQPEGSFKAAEARYTSVDEIQKKDLKRWLKKAKEIQWDYKNIVKRKGKLTRLK